jgi:uncharacterized membrane protein
MPKKKLLIAGESWIKHTSHIKGFDIFTSCEYETGVTWLKEALEHGGFDVVHMPGHAVPDSFPFSVGELSNYAAVVLSDIGANSLQLPTATFGGGRAMPDRCQVIADYVRSGGALAMIGGYLSFSGIDAKARYWATAIADVLPVAMQKCDDRVECPQGVRPRPFEESHPIMKGLGEWPAFLGYNRTFIKEEQGVRCLAVIGDDDPFIAVRDYGEGRAGVFVSDAAPHWGPTEFLEWPGYKVFWKRFLKWLAKLKV